MNLDQANHVHFVGIGGAGMSAVAKVLLERGFRISGSDLKKSRAAVMLEAMGATVSVGHDAANVDGADVVVVSSAIPAHNLERRRALELGLPLFGRGEALAFVLSDRKSIVVAGTHGKTTTTSMIVSVLHSAGRDPTYLVGGGLNDSGTNARFGRDEWAVAESDESDGSFLLLSPQIAVVTNVEADHLDYWGSFAAVQDAFRQFIEAVVDGGCSVLSSGHDPELMSSPGASKSRVLSFGDAGDVRAAGVSLEATGASFILECRDGSAPVRLQVPGAHNVSNALAAAAACLEMGVSVRAVARGLGAFRGVERRFQVRGELKGVTVVDDYAHHPTEVRAVLEAGRGGRSRIVAVFQPHRYSRTAALAESFGDSFGNADRVVVTDVYGAGEHPVPGVTGKLVADSVCAHLPGRPVAYLPHRTELIDYLATIVRSGDLVMTLGAGDVTSVGEELLARLGEAS